MTEKTCRTKTGKREISLVIFAVCLGWSMYSGDKAFMEMTFIPTLMMLTGALGMHEWTENIKGRFK